MKFSEAVKFKITTCAKCYTVVYGLPCATDIKLASYLRDFGLPIYALDIIGLLKIESTTGFDIETRLGSKKIKFIMPKRFEKIAWENQAERIKFEKALADWITDTLCIEIEG